MNEIDRALMIIENLFSLAPDNAFSKLAQLLKYAILKEKTNAFQVMTPDFQRTCRRDMEWSYYVAVNFALLGGKDEALDWMNNAIERGFMNYPALEKEPFLDNIRSEPRFKELMVRVKKEWEEFEV